MTEALKGLNALSKKLNELEIQVAKKTLRKAVVEAAKPVQRSIKMAAPVSDRPQTQAVLSHKGNPKFPGFLKRSVTRASRFRRGFAMVDIGVKSEAFYGVSFVDRGTRFQPAQSWFKKTFLEKVPQMERDMAKALGDEIERIARK